MLVANVVHVPHVIFRDVNGVMRDAIVCAAQAKVHHESRTGEALLIELVILPAAAQLVRNKTRHGARKIGIHYNRIGFVLARSGPNAGRLTSFDQDLLGRFVQSDFNAELLADPAERSGYRAAAAHWMIDTVLVFEKGKNGEETGAFEGRHAQVFRLKRKCQAHPLVIEIPAEL